jgi:hypothetical protein
MRRNGLSGRSLRRPFDSLARDCIDRLGPHPHLRVRQELHAQASHNLLGRAPALQQILNDLSQPLVDPASRLQIGLGTIELATQLHVLHRVSARRAWTARLGLQRPERAPVALLAPLPQMRAIQPLAAHQRADLTRLGARVGLTHDRQLIRRAKPPTRRLRHQLGVRDPLRRSAPAGGETQLAYGSLRSSTGGIGL